MDKVTNLTKTEYEVMDVLWSADRGLLMTEILDVVNHKYGRKWKRQTLCTYLSNLVKKGVIQSDKEDRYYHYRMVIPKSEYQIMEAKHFMEFWCNHSLKQYLSALTGTKMLTKKEYEKINKLIDELDD